MEGEMVTFEFINKRKKVKHSLAREGYMLDDDGYIDHMISLYGTDVRRITAHVEKDYKFEV
jgi:hypothetical protein